MIHKVNLETKNATTKTTHHSKGMKVYLYPRINNHKMPVRGGEKNHHQDSKNTQT